MKIKLYTLVALLMFVLFASFFQPLSVKAQSCNPNDPFCPGGGASGSGGQTGNQNGGGGQTGNQNGGGGQTGNQNGSGGQTGNQNGGIVPLTNPITAQNIQQLVAKVLELVVKVGAPVILFFLIYVGFLFATARGNVAQLEKAKRALIWTLIGGLIILGAQVLSSIIQNTIDQIWHG
jgi:hypothetical protein